MIALDTNILVRAIVDEENANAATREQQQHAQALLVSGQQLFIAVTVVEELEWVLRGVYGMSREEEVAALFDDMLAVENLVLDRAAAIKQAVAWYRDGLDFSDALHLAQSSLCTGLATFDERFAKRAQRLNLQPPVTIA